MPRTRKQKAKAAVLSWIAKNRKAWKVKSVRHIHPSCYVIGYAAPSCLIVVLPWMDSESHMKTWDKVNSLADTREFESGLKPGDWCISAYVSVQDRGGWTVCVKAVA